MRKGRCKGKKTLRGDEGESFESMYWVGFDLNMLENKLIPRVNENL